MEEHRSTGFFILPTENVAIRLFSQVTQPTTKKIKCLIRFVRE